MNEFKMYINEAKEKINALFIMLFIFVSVLSVERFFNYFSEEYKNGKLVLEALNKTGKFQCNNFLIKKKDKYYYISGANYFENGEYTLTDGVILRKSNTTRSVRSVGIHLGKYCQKNINRDRDEFK